MRIGISLLSLGTSFGGSYQYAATFARHLLATDLTNEYVIFHDDEAFLQAGLAGPNVTLVSVDRPKTDWKWYLVSLLRLAYLAGVPINMPAVRGRYDVLARSGLDLLIQPGHGVGAFLSDIPYLVSIHDGPHVWDREMRRRVGFVGVRMAGLHARAHASRARAIFVDSQVGKAGLMRTYGVPSDKIHVLPFRAPDYVNNRGHEETVATVKEKYDLPSSYLFYPSGFYPPKNHLGLVTALDIVRRRFDLTLPLVLVGHSGPTLEAVMQLAAELGLKDGVRYLGFVEDRDMAPLYKLATALVMPTFIGPTNIPVMEAFTVGCPVICSRITGYDEQIGEAGLLIDPRSPEELAEAIYRVYSDKALRETLIRRGYERASQLSSIDYGKEIARVAEQELSSLGPRTFAAAQDGVYAGMASPTPAPAPRIIDLGCGTTKREPAAIGVDIVPSPATDVICDLESFPWPFQDNSFDLVFCSHIIEHVNDVVRFMEEAHRIAKPGAIVKGLTPHFTNPYSYVDPTHKHHLSVRAFDLFCEASSVKVGVFRGVLNRVLDLHHQPEVFHTRASFEKVKVGLLMGKFYRCTGVSWFANHFPEFYELQGGLRAPCNIYFELKVKK